MSRLGQCPSCHVVYELEDDSIGHAFQCECGSALFACDVAGFSEIPVVCTQCQGEYVVDGEGAGEVVECECGAQLTVPTVVLRAPVQSSDQSAQLLEEEEPEPERPSPETSVQCPACGQSYAVSDEDKGDQAACKCGCTFKIAKKPDGTFVAKRAQPKDQRKEGSEADSEAKEKPAKRKQPMSLFSILGLAGVALLLLVSIIMFATRDRGSVASAEANKTKSSSKDAANKNVLEGIGEGSISAVQPIPDIPTIPNQAATSTTGSDPDQSNEGGMQALLAPPPARAIPQPKPARTVVPIIPSKYMGQTFQRAYAEAFEAYSETNRLKAAAEKSGDNQEYHQQLGRTLGLLQQTLTLATSEPENDKVHELRYLLTYLYFTGGHLVESSILGEAVARWGDIKEGSTKEAAMIALAAAQEANETGWADASEGGELNQMRTLAELISSRWPDHPQKDLIWLGLGQRYDSFAKPLSAADAYGRVQAKSPHYGTAQLAAGGVLWAHYRREIASGAVSGPQKSVDLRDRAQKHFETGVEKISGEKPSLPLIAAKVSLAKIAVLRGDMEAAEAWLVDEPNSVVQAVTLDKASGNNVQVTEPFLRMAFETLFTIRTQRRDPAGAKSALEQMAAKLGPGKNTQVGKLFLGVATDYIDQLLASAVVTREQFSTLSELIEPLKEHESTLTAANVLWLGESWSRLAPHASTPQLTKQCYGKAAGAYELAMSREDFPASSRQSATLRRAQLLRNAGMVADAIPLLESILKDNANAFGLQIEAAEALQQAAFDASKPSMLASAIHGPLDDQGQSTGSPIWGWAKLVTTLHSAGGTTDKDADRLLKCQYHLANCQLLIANATTDPGRQEQLQEDLRRSLQRLIATTSPEREPWYGQLKGLQTQLK